MTQMLEISAGTAKAGHQSLFKEVSLNFCPGEFTCILGPNGAGKSSLLKTLAGLQKLTSGGVKLDGQPIELFSPISRARLMSYLPQIRPLAWPIRVEDAVALGRFAYGAAPGGSLSERDRDAVNTALTACDLTELTTRRTDTLSGGELARVHIARALAGKAPILLADEPMAALDPRHQLRIMDLIRSYASDGGSAIVVMHDMSLAAKYADRLIWMKNGCVVADGPPSETLTPDTIHTVFEVTAEITGNQITLTV